jgi:hypothetical protein
MYKEVYPATFQFMSTIRTEETLKEQLSEEFQEILKN